MKSFSVLHIVLFLLMLLMYQCAKAQDYVITSDGDTLRGDVRLFNTAPDRRVQLNVSGKKTSYTILNVRSLSYKGDVYHRVHSGTEYAFMKVLKHGYLSLYSYQLPSQSTYDGLLLVKRDGNRLPVPNLAFKKVMSKFLSDCDSLSSQIKRGEYGRNDLDTIINIYNDCIQARSNQAIAAVAEEKKVMEKSEPWQDLYTRLSEAADFEGKSDALDMITEIRGKIARHEKVPKFLVEGLKSSLSQSAFRQDLEEALNTLEQ